MNIIIAVLIVSFINIPFGYWRANVKRFSSQWIAAIHIPIIIVVLLRIYTTLGLELYTYPILIAAYFLGQFIGSKIYIKRVTLKLEPVTSCLVMDVYRNIKS
ncbi:MAG: hypothetical protein JSW63_09545 [Ignavibacterium sp.]|nr:MAG: hypothetical protein JSW63_09545 [Ignavibacterium sp.]